MSFGSTTNIDRRLIRVPELLTDFERAKGFATAEVSCIEEDTSFDSYCHGGFGLHHSHDFQCRTTIHERQDDIRMGRRIASAIQRLQMSHSQCYGQQGHIKDGHFTFCRHCTKAPSRALR